MIQTIIEIKLIIIQIVVFLAPFHLRKIKQSNTVKNEANATQLQISTGAHCRVQSIPYKQSGANSQLFEKDNEHLWINTSTGGTL